MSHNTKVVTRLLVNIVCVEWNCIRVNELIRVFRSLHYLYRFFQYLSVIVEFQLVSFYNFWLISIWPIKARIAFNPTYTMDFSCSTCWNICLFCIHSWSDALDWSLWSWVLTWLHCRSLVSLESASQWELAQVVCLPLFYFGFQHP